MSNIAKSWFFLFALSLTLIVLGHVALGREGLLIGLMISLGMNCYVYFFEDQRIIKKFNGQLLEGQDPWGLLTTNRRLAAKMRTPLPNLILLNDEAPQSLVVGRSLTTGTIALTNGLLKRLEPDEIEAILAYGIACIQNLNTLSFSVASFLANLLLSFTGALDMGLRILIVEKKNSNDPLSQLFTRLASPLVGFLIRSSVRPTIYHKADLLAVDATKNPEALARAIWKLNAFTNTLPHSTQYSISHMYVVNPLTSPSWTRYFHAQPDISERIRNIVGYYPL